MRHKITALITMLNLSNSVITTFGIIVLVTIFLLLAKRVLILKPSFLQTVLEGIVTVMKNAVIAVLPEQAELVFPFIATLWVFIFISNIIGVIPTLQSPTSDLSVTSALAVLVFFSVHWFGIKAEGLKKYLRHYLLPSPFLLPFHLLGEVTRTLALAVRLFGNMMSLQLTALIILTVAGFLVPVPVLMLHIVEACLQTYIFGMLALIYIAGGIQSQQLRKESLK